MAKNFIMDGRLITLAVPVGVKSGDPVLVGNMTGVAQIDRDTNGNATVDFGGVYNLSAKAVDDAGNNAIAIGDPIYYVSADNPKLSKKASGYLFGFALAAVGAGLTASIDIKTIDAMGTGSADIPANSVTAAKAKTFFSAEQTGTGAAQNIPHGLGAVPSKVLIALTGGPAAYAQPSVVQGVHDAINVVATVTTGWKYTIFAWA